MSHILPRTILRSGSFVFNRRVPKAVVQDFGQEVVRALLQSPQTTNPRNRNSAFKSIRAGAIRRQFPRRQRDFILSTDLFGAYIEAQIGISGHDAPHGLWKLTLLLFGEIRRVEILPLWLDIAGQRLVGRRRPPCALASERAGVFERALCDYPVVDRCSECLQRRIRDRFGDV